MLMGTEDLLRNLPEDKFMLTGTEDLLRNLAEDKASC